MTVKETNIKNQRIIFCKCSGDRIPADTLVAVEERLHSADAEVIMLSDLCGIAAKDPGSLADVFGNGKDVTVIGCWYRTMRLLFGQIKDIVMPGGWAHFNLTEASKEDVLSRIDSCFGNTKSGNGFRQITYESDWPSWYPVIDYDRCTACAQCADFCLFGVYEKAMDGVKVVNPERCKNNCPACARICPATAIIFPKYRHGGAIGGSDEIDEFAEQERQTKDVSDILGGDIYSALERRKIKRKSIILQESMRKAEEEREKALLENNK